MNYTTTINKVIDYIEENLEKKLELKQLASIANISPYHFHRVFSRETGEKVNDYIIRRKLTQASFDLLDSNDYLIDISLKYGFDSPQSFSRSFKKLFSKSPIKYRKDNIVKIDQVKTKLAYSGDESFTYKIIKKSKLYLTGFEVVTDWDSVMNQVNNLFYLIYYHLQNKTLLPIENCIYMVSDNDKTFLGVPTEMTSKLSGEMVTREVPEKNYIVFEHMGSVDKIYATFDNIYNKLIPTIENIEIDDSFILEQFNESHHPEYFNYNTEYDYSSEKVQDSYGFSDSFYFEILLPLKA